MNVHQAPRPATVQGDLRNLPPALAPLKALPNWVVWRWSWKANKAGDGKWSKVPFRAINPSQFAKNNDPSTWGTYEQALATFEARLCDGIGFNLSGTNFAAFDIDKCRDPATGAIASEAMALVGDAASYTEITVSGTGLRVIGFGSGEKVHRKHVLPGSTVEVESYRGAERYIVVTGNHLTGASSDIGNMTEVMDEFVARRDSNVVKFKPLVPSAPLLPAWGSPPWGLPPIPLLPPDLAILIERGPAPGDDHSGTFFRVVCRLRDQGMSAAAIESHIAGKPIVPPRYHHRLAGEIARCMSRENTHAGPASIVTEDNAAMQFAAAFRDKLRYCHDSGQWFEWTGSVWQANKTDKAFSWAREFVRSLSASEPDKVRYVTGKAAFASSVERFCRSDPGLAVTSDNWDADGFLLGTPGGTVDLRTGLLRPSLPSDGITRSTSVAPAPAADCERWWSFLGEATGGDIALMMFLQQWAGYALTGDTREHALVFVHGLGGNGKSVFLNALTGILGSYATTAAMDTFTASKGDKHPTDLAMLRGARLVTASETEEGRAWAEARIKAMTGGDPITARFMRQDFFTFRPSFKLTVVGNHRPVLKNVDDAARRRFNIVPFTQKPAVVDHQLEDKLRAEWPAILRWAIDGCVDWQKRGLVRPAVVTAATSDYFNEQDLFGQWLDERCEVEIGNPHKWETVAALYASWSAYARLAGDDAGSVKAFNPKMLTKGLQPCRKSQARGFAGVCLKPLVPPFPVPE